MAWQIESGAIDKTKGRTAGNKCFLPIHSGLEPKATAANTYSLLRKLRTSERTIRYIVVHEKNLK